MHGQDLLAGVLSLRPFDPDCIVHIENAGKGSLCLHVEHLAVALGKFFLPFSVEAILNKPAFPIAH